MCCRLGLGLPTGLREQAEESDIRAAREVDLDRVRGIQGLGRCIDLHRPVILRFEV